MKPKRRKKIVESEYESVGVQIRGGIVIEIEDGDGSGKMVGKGGKKMEEIV